MPKQEKQTLLPKLRFPEFREAGEWSKDKLGAVATLHKGKGISKAEIVANGVQPCIRYGELYTIYGETIHETASSTNVDASELFLSKRNDVIIPASGETKIDIAKASCVMKDDIALGGDLNVIRSSQNGIFLSYQLNGPLRSSIARVAQGDSVVHLYPTQIERLDVLVPSPPEQQKIADCLASLDELITLEAQQLDTLKTHKKGLMQVLFPSRGGVPEGRGGEYAEATTPRLRRTPPKEGNYPRLRFPEFRDAGEWEEKTLGQVAKYENGKAHEQDIAESGEFVVVNSKFISTEGEVRKFTDSAFCIAEKDDILMVLSDVPNGRAIAKCFVVDSDHQYTVNQRICKLTPYKAVSILLFYVLNRNSYFLAFDDGVKQTNLKKDDVLDCPILLPKNLKEQQKIADCLASLDNLITAQTQKLAALKIHKKGLMQQLFPDTATTPPLRGTPPEEGNKSSRAPNSPPVEGWTAKLDGVVNMQAKPDGAV